jgi:hypothetical protein
MRAEKKNAKTIHIEKGVLFYYRPNGVVTRIEIDDLKRVELKVLKFEIYWHLIDTQDNFALIPESVSDIGILRRYLSNWRGFNYDGLLRFDWTKQTRMQLWPIEEAEVA